MSRMGRAILFGMAVGLLLVAIVWGIEYALGAPEDVYGVSELACMSVAAILMLHRYGDEIVKDGRRSRRRSGKSPA
jgi:hypothetical protein